MISINSTKPVLCKNFSHSNLQKMNSKSRLQIILYALIPLLSFTSCVIGLSNAEHRLPEKFSHIFIPSAHDSSAYSGNSSRLTFAVRNLVAQRTGVTLTSIEKARWALEMRIIDRIQAINVVDNCNNPGNARVASGAYQCAEIHPEMKGGPATAPTSFTHPSVSPSSENMMLVVRVRAIDLNDGHVFWSKFYNGNLPLVVFNEIGDTDGRTIANMQNTPDLHALRYQEAVDNAVNSYATAIANDLQSLIFSSSLN